MENTQIGLASKLNATTLPVSADLLLKAKETLSTNALPTSRVEAWKYTRLAKLGKINFSNNIGEVDRISEYIISEEATTFVFINGNFSSEHSSSSIPKGLTIHSLSNSKELMTNSLISIEGEVFNALNTVFLNDGIHIVIDDKAIIDTPIQIIHILDGEETISNFKVIIEAGKFSKASIIEGYFCTDNCKSSFVNSTSEITVGENAFLTIDKLQYENESSFHISTEQVDQKKDSTFTINSITLNGMLVRNNLNIDVNGENCTTNLNGAYLLKDKQHVDNHTVVNHKVPNCESHELYKGVMDDKSTAVFNGKVFVRPDAQKINAFQSNGNVLLSDDATINSKPELEIYADDVKCSHGSTTGQLDDEAIFYLQARGISKKSAKKLLVSAFVNDVFNKIENEDVKSFIDTKLQARFDWIG